MKRRNIYHMGLIVLVLLHVSLATLAASQLLAKTVAPIPQVIFPSEGECGWAIAVSGSTIIAGDDSASPFGLSSGAAHIFRRKSGQWIQQATLVPSDGEELAWFGRSVDVDGRIAVVGAPGPTSKVYLTGAVYVFRRKGGSWKEEAKLTAPIPEIRDRFGCSVAISGTTIVVGAKGKGHAGEKSGAVYVFKRINKIWIQEATLTPMDAAPGKQFGKSVDISRNKIVIGTGLSAYVFERKGGQWIEHSKLEGTGALVAISGKTIVVGKDRAEAAFVYKRKGGNWIQQATLKADESSSRDQRFGDEVAIDGDTIVIGDWGYTPAGKYSGSAYVFRYQGNEWIQKIKLTSPYAEPWDFFGASVGVYDKTIVVGATSADGARRNSGAIFVFKLGKSTI